MAIDPAAAAGKMKGSLAPALALRTTPRDQTVMPYELHDIVMLRIDLGGKVYAIVEVKPFFAGTEYIAVKLDKGPFVKRYKLRDDDIAAKIGTLDPGALERDSPAFKISPPDNWQLGQGFARYMAERSPLELDRQRWAFLAACQPGDSIFLRHETSRGSRLEPHRFLEVLPEGQKYHFCAINLNGTVYRFPLDAIPLGMQRPPADRTARPDSGAPETPT